MSPTPTASPSPATADYLSSLFALGGRRALITGGSSGIGRAIARALARSGAEVGLIARTEGALIETVAEFSSYGAVASYDVCDLATLTPERAQDLASDVDILVNCAGVNHRPPLGETTTDEYDELVAVNLRAPYLLGQVAGPAMAARDFGRIINVGSQQTWMAFGNSGVYGMTKAGIAGLSRSQSEAWAASGVTSNTLIPGFVVTPMTQATVAVPGVEERLAARHHVGRNGVPADFESAAVFLASPASAFVTGQTIAVDGGFSVH